MSKKRPRRVALAFPSSVPWMAQCLQGIAAYAQQRGGWTFVTSPPTLGGAEELALTAYALRHWPGDGVIAAIHGPHEARAARRLRIPVVNLSGVLRHCGLPRVMVDQQAVGRLAAEHLLERGLRRLAFYGLRGPWYSQQRLRGFLQRAAQDQVPCEVLEAPPSSDARASWTRRTASLAQWLRTLQPPVGVLAVHDYRARVLVDECLNLGLRVPHDVAVLGVDNDTTVCEFCPPTLSSISRGPWQVGYEAAAMLERLMAGRRAPAADLLLAPEGVVARRSTETVVVENAHVREAIQFMHDHLGESFTVEQLVQQAAVSRRLLEKRFRQHLDCTPREYLCRLRIERAKQILAGASKPRVPDLARACGFADAKRFRLAFHRLVGLSPMRYRRSILRSPG